MTILKKILPIIYTLMGLLFSFEKVLSQDHPAPPDPPAQREIEAVLAQAPKVSQANLRDLHIVLLASEKDHGLHEHDYPRWQKNWALLLGGEQSRSEATQINMYGPANHLDSDEIQTGTAKVTVSTAWDWPSQKQFQEADLIAAFSVIQWSDERNAELKEFLVQGGGFVTIHQSCVVQDVAGLADDVADLIGLSWNWDTTRWRHGPMNLDIAQANHSICLGLPPQLYFMDEAYWPLYGDRAKVDIVATSKETVGSFALRREDGKPDFSNMGAIQQKWPEEPTTDEPMFWTHEYGKGRVYGCILGHYTWTFDDPYFRILLLRGLAWAAGESPYRFDSLVLRGATIK